MKQRPSLRRAFSFFLALVLALSLLPASALAAGNAVASVGGQPYTKLSDAWNQAVSSGQTLELLQDATIGDRLKLEKGKSLTVNMNGHTIDRGRSSSTSDGEVIWVGENATLTLKGSGTVTGGWSTNGAGGIHMKKNAKVTLDGVTVSGNRAERSWGSDGYGGGVMMAGTGGQLVMKNGAAIQNNRAAYGGGVYIDKENCTISMDNAHIDNNYSENGGGGVYSYDLKTVIDMTNQSTINNNSATEGGGIYFDYTQFLLKSSDGTAQISNNTARDGNGGGVYMEHNRSVAFIGNTNSGTVQGITFDQNKAQNGGWGGALYIQQESIAVSNCKLTNNSAAYGGGIYVNNDLNSVSGCTITGNTATSAGGGIYTSSMNDFSLSGKVIIQGNTRSGDTADDDLFLNSNWATTSYLTASPTGQSRIGIRMNSPSERKLGKDQQFYFEDAFFYDGTDYHIEFKEDKAELWLVEGTKKPVGSTTVSPGTRDTGTDFNGKDVIQGYFSYPSVVETTDDLDAAFYYSDGYFLDGTNAKSGDPTVYNEHLATMSMTMAMAGFYSNIGNDGSKKTDADDLTYTYKSQNIRKLFSDIGVNAENIYVSDSNAVKPGINTIGVAIGQKTIGATETEGGYVLVPIAVRGAGYESEWYGNTSVGASGEHEGFAIAADQVFQQVQNYIENYGLTDKINQGKVKFWIAGYSRAGATSNLTAKRLIEAYCAQNGSNAMNNQVYAYCFEAPKGGLNSAMKLDAEKYYSIHNCINKADAVPLVAPEEMGFIRYGVDHYIPGGTAGLINASSNVWSYVKTWVSADKGYTTWYDNTAYATYSDQYKAQRTEMLKQLKAVDPTNIYFYDNFSAATVEYIKSVYGQPLIQMVPTYKGEKGLTQEEFGPVLIRALQSWGFYRSYDANFRNGYSGQFSNSEGKVGVSFEYALQTVTKILFSKSAADLNGMMEAASSTMDRLSTGQLLDIWDDMIGDWTTLSQSKRESYLQMLWDAVVEGTNVEGKSVATYLTAGEKTELRSVWNVLLDVLLRFVEVDYNTELYNLNNSKTPINSVKTPVAEEYADSLKTYDSAHTQAVLGTLAYNATALMQAHYPEINFAWLRSYDSNYTGEANQSYQITAQEAPTVEAEQVDNTITLSTTTPGASIFYKVGDSVWRPYNKPLDLNGNELTISYTAVYCGATSDVKDGTFKPESTYHTIKVNGDEYGRYKVGEVVTVEAKVPEDKSFVEWGGSGTEGLTLLNGKTSDSSAPTNPELKQGLQNSAITFKMPDKDLDFTTTTVDKIKNIEVTVNENGKTQEIKLDDKAPITDTEASKLIFNYSVQDNPSQVSTYAAENTEKATIEAQALLNPSKANNVFFSAKTKAKINGKDCAVTYNPYDGSVTLTATDEREIKRDDYCTITVNCYDMNRKDENGVVGVVDTTLTYTVKKGDPLTLVAPSVRDEHFEKWRTGTGTELTISNRQVTFTPTGDMTIEAEYIPVVKKIDITIPEPEVGKTLPASVSQVKVTITNEYEIDTNSIVPLWINWLDSTFGVNGTVVAGDWYVVSLFPFLSGGEFTYNYTLADNVELWVNGTKLTNDFLLYNGEGSTPVVYCVFEAGGGLVTLGNELVSVQQPATKVLEYGEDLTLPENVSVNISDGTKQTASVQWDQYSYDKSIQEAQSFIVTGKVQYNNNPNGVDTTVQQTVVVNGAKKAAQVATPTANIAAGTYTEAQEIRLDCDTDGATIYYTLDGSEPTTTNGTKYDGGIVTVSSYGTTKLRMIAVEAGMRDSMEASYQYELKKPSTRPSDKPSKPTTPTEPTSSFQDVSKDAYYADAVAWAVKKGITNGISQTQFGPDQGCTRAQIVTFLWRSAGSPEPKTLTSFADVPADAYYAKAVAWAVEQGITKGTSETAFSPLATCTRAQSVTFLHRADGSPAAEKENGFSDVAQDSYYADAVNWAADEGITSGTSESTFSPALTCTRAQIVTFLYRMEQGK